ncbi:uncharacterized protein PRCAT00001694001 [Priceomyces carsonii]|uniref:uncharacterized protein n=1 Tax=Priceomyces carsonii TaxID=28549 RepID=UPI002EDB475A|nr:unnamed protein product [Priceomyces carsonii]
MLASFFPNVAKEVLYKRQAVNILIHTRNKMKSHKAAAKRFIKTGDGFKRKQVGRNHGNGGFSFNSLRHLNSFVPVTAKGGHLKKLKKYL